MPKPVRLRNVPRAGLLLFRLKGLCNLGQTCYTSAVLQAVAHNTVIHNQFLIDGHDVQKCGPEHCISCLIQEAIKALWTGDRLMGYAAQKHLNAD